ncbi:hypothetical protein B4168_3159 [Anoxybacillus flavithermus]|nr:hypothetical protein B4168_3159 [Anoxybacillus flavithermus]OAO86446.1 methylene tetrahydromethanopterin reductase / flavin-dependent oxidoreductase [Parageobacillus thermoglucosidasius]
MIRFEKHKGYSRMFKENHLTLGLFFPIESYEGSVPEIANKTGKKSRGT